MATPPSVPRRTLASRVRSLLSFGAFVGALLFTRASLADHYRVPTGSMEPNVEVADHVLVVKAAYGLRVPMTDRYVFGPSTPARGDVVVLTSPESGIVLLKRVVAVGGDRVAVEGGHVRVRSGEDSGTRAREGVDFSISLTFGGGPDLPETVVPEGKVLVLGDNRGNSHDGREFGFVDATSVLGRAAVVVGGRGVRGL
jgi:signal peptidase I